MLKNMWYVVADCSEVANAPTKVTVLGLDFVVFRDSKGVAHCISDTCIHRGASLGKGRVVDDCVECPYHGWRFAGDGCVTKIPAQTDCKIPKSARVDHYPVKELYGWVWVFFGDLPEEERPPLPDFPEYDSPDWRCIRGEFKWDADYARVVENGLDFAHAPFVHPSFGEKEHGEIEDFKVEKHDWGANAKITYKPPVPRGLWKLLRKEKTPVKANPSFHLSGALMCLKVQVTSKWNMIIYDVNTPIDSRTTLTRWVMARNFMKSSFADRDSRRRVLAIFDQDAAVVEAVKPERLPFDLTEELSIKSDGLQMAYRQMRRKLIKKGWGIDTEKWEAEYKGKRAVAIPSPSRNIPENDRWVLPEIPTL